MRIILKRINGYLKCIDIGFYTKYHSCVYFITIHEYFYDGSGKIEHSNLLFKFFKHPKFWEWKKIKL